MSVKNIGIEANPPSKTCEDKLCPWHGSLPVRGRIIEGRVTSNSMNGAIVIRRDFLHLVRKFNRYERRKGLVTARLPPCIDVRVGDNVRVMECRPLAKSISFVAIEKLEEKH
jgi:small subunit ribosomal protein S17